MTCKTHVVAANATALLLTQPNNINSLALCMVSATIGGLICDLDVVTSDSHKYVDRFVLFTVLGIILTIFLEMFFNLGITEWINKNSSYLNISITAIIFLFVCFFGMHQPHRSFMHSITGLIILSFILLLTFQEIVIPFSLGMLSHILLDLFNKKGIQLFYPFKKRFELKLCSADGIINNILFIFFTAILAFELFII